MSLWDVMVSIFWFFLLLAWISLLISLLADVFRDPDMSGWGKAGWVLFLIAMPWIGALTYLVVRGRSMSERAWSQAEHGFGPYGQDTSPRPAGTAQELAALADLRDRGAISGEDYARAKAIVLNQPATSSR